MIRPNLPIKLCCNPNNPYDWIGQGHNYIISYNYTNNYAEIMAIADLTMRQARIKELINDAMDIFYGSHIDLDVLNTIYGYQGLYSEVDFSNYQAIFNNIPSLIQDEKKNLTAFFDLLTPLVLNDNLDCSLALNAATNFENDFLRSYQNIIDMKVLSTISIAKYSLYSAFNNPSPYPEAQKRKIKWWHVLADACGGIIGGIAGGVVGALEGAAAGTEIYDLCTES